MANINLSDLFFHDDEPLDERIVQIFMGQIRNGKPMVMPVVMRRKDGKYDVVDGRKRVVAAVLCAQKTIEAYVVEEVSREKFLELRKALNGTTRPSN